jgi:hypothetical protein
MGRITVLDRIREFIGRIAFSIFLWAYRMSEDEYRSEILEDARREYLSEKATAWMNK